MNKKARILVIGAGAVARAYVKKAMLFADKMDQLHVASKTFSKCQALKAECQDAIHIHQIDADNVELLSKLIKQIKPDVVVNLALPYQDLNIMKSCIACKVHYIDTANYEPIDEAKFSYHWQWDFDQQFQQAGILGLLGCGFDPGVTNVFCQYSASHLFDQIDSIDILDCNGGDHGHPFATNFNPEINIREITQDGKYYQQGQWHEIPALSMHEKINFPEIGEKNAYLIYHEELESLNKHLPEIKQLRFWMTFSDAYLNHLKVLQNVGLTRIDPINYQGQEIVPLQFLKACLPDPSSLASNYKGKTCIGCFVKGQKNKQQKSIFIYNVCDHEKCFEELGVQAVSYTTAIPALLATHLLIENIWTGTGVKNIEQFDPQPFMDRLGDYGLAWQVKHDVEFNSL